MSSGVVEEIFWYVFLGLYDLRNSYVINEMYKIPLIGFGNVSETFIQSRVFNKPSNSLDG